MQKRRLLNLRKLWLSLLLMVGATAIAVPGIQEIAGTEEDVVEIGTVEELKDFRDAVNSGNTYADKTVKLTADLDLSSESNWTPIGNLVAYPGQSFNGTFDGDGHTISNLTVNDNTPKYAVAGLFGSVVNGTIKNLTVKNVNITSTHYAAGIVAYTSNGPTIENCHVIGGTIKSTPELVGNAYDNGDKVGGIMGYSTKGSTINNCTVEGVTISGYRDLGGIVGYSDGNVTNNTAKNVTVTQDLTNGYKDTPPTTIGDIVGRGSATNNVEANGNKVIKSDPVAQIGEIKYETIADAVAAATASDVIEIIKAGDYTLPNLSKNVTIEGKADGEVSFTHTSAGSVASIPSGATFKNVTFNFGNNNYHGFQHAGTINMEGCTLNGKLFSYGDMNFTDCEFNQTNSDYHMWAYSGNLTYTGCTFTNTATGKFLNVYNESGATKYTVTANNCKFVNTASAANKAAINVKATSGSNLLAYDVIINNCTTEGAFPEASESQALVVLKDLVQVDDRTADGVDNIKVYENDVLIYPVNYVAKIGDVKYETLEEAFAAAKDGEIITLLANCTGNGIKAPQGKFTTGLTVDFAGFTYTVDGSTVGSTGTETNGFQLLKDNKITFKNGTITSEKAKILVQNYSDLTLESMTLTLNNANYTSAYTLSNNNGKIVIDGTTINANEAGGFAFDVCRYSSYPSVGVTVKGESVINGDIEFDAGSGDPKDGANLTVEGGTITGNLRPTSGGSTALTDHSDKASVTKSDAVELAAPADFKWVSNGDGTSTLKPCEYVAAIGDVKYETLADAVAAVKDGETILMLADVPNAGGMKVASGKNFTVDFDGHTYTLNKPGAGSTGTETNGFQLLKNSTIVFKNGTINIAEENLTQAVAPAKNIMRIIQNYANLTLEDMTIDGTNQYGGNDYIMSFNNGTSVIKDTKVVGADKIAFDVCTWSSYKATNLDVTGNSEIKGDIEISSTNTPDALSLMLTSGTHDGAIIMAQGADKATVSKVNEFVQAAPEGYKWVDNGDGTSTLKPCEYICAIGDVKYETLQDAVNAAGTAETTITLLTDAATEGVISGNGVKVPSGSNITFDLNGLTYDASGVTVGSTSTETQGFQLLKGSNITFKNGTLKATSPSAQMLIQNYSNLTLEDVNLDGTGLSGWAYALSNNCGTINLTGSTSITAKEGGRAFDTCKFGSYEIPTVNINTTSTISGTIEATGGKLNIENGKFNVTWVTDNNYNAGDIQIKGGVFTEEPAEEYCAEGYVPTDNTDEETKEQYPYAVMTKEDAGIFELIDGKVYPYLDYTEDKQAASVTYKRNFTNKNWQALFIPFDINDVTELTDKYEFAKIHMVALENDGTFTTGNKIEIYYTRITSGKISANQPYLIKAKNTGWQDIVVENTILKDTHNMKPRKTSTMAADYIFTGTYEGYEGTKDYEFLAMGKGTINWGGKGTKLGTYRWYIKPEIYDDNYAKPSISFIEVDEEATGISAASSSENAEIEGYYSVNGVRSEVPVKGMNIIKYKNGKTKKIMIK